MGLRNWVCKHSNLTQTIVPAQRNSNDFEGMPINVLENEEVSILPNSSGNYPKETRPQHPTLLQMQMTTKVRRKPNLKKVRKEPDLLIIWIDIHPHFLCSHTIPKNIENVFYFMATNVTRVVETQTSPSALRVSKKSLLIS
ncbi:hypothetical protein V6Z11_D01G107200 [Gossypium hirsutum]